MGKFPFSLEWESSSTKKQRKFKEGRKTGNARQGVERHGKENVTAFVAEGPALRIWARVGELEKTRARVEDDRGSSTKKGERK